MTKKWLNKVEKLKIAIADAKPGMRELRDHFTAACDKDSNELVWHVEVIEGVERHLDSATEALEDLLGFYEE